MEKLTNTINEIVRAIQNGDVKKINSFLNKDLYHESVEDLYEIAEILMTYGYLYESDRIFEHLLFLFPEENQLKIDRAAVLIELGDEDKGLDLLMEIDPNTPEYPQSLLVLADYYQSQGLYEVAEQRIEEAIDILPHEPLLKFAKAELLLEMGRFSEAARIYNELYEQKHRIENVSLAERLAEVYRSGGNYEEALQYYKEALDEKVTPDLLFGSAYSAFQCEKYEFAIKQLENLKELDPDYFSAYLLLSQSYAMIEDNKSAYRVIKEGIKRDEFDKTFYLFAGKIAIKIGLVSEAIQHLKQAIALDPEYMEAIFVLVSVLSQEEMYEEVIDLYENIRRDHLDWSGLYPFVAQAYQQTEQYGRAYEIYSLAYNDFKEDTLFLEKYCYFLIEYGKREDAKRVLERLITLEPSEPEWQDLLYTLE